MAVVKIRNATGHFVPVKVSEEIARQVESGEKTFVLVKDINGREVPVEVNEDVYQLFIEEYRYHVHTDHERRDHLDSHSLDDYFVIHQAVSEALEADFFGHRFTLLQIQDVLDSCTVSQQRRFYLKHICGFTFKEIAEIEGIKKQAVHDSVRYVDKKIKNFFYEP